MTVLAAEDVAGADLRGVRCFGGGILGGGGIAITGGLVLSGRGAVDIGSVLVVATVEEDMTELGRIAGMSGDKDLLPIVCTYVGPIAIGGGRLLASEESGRAPKVA